MFIPSSLYISFFEPLNIRHMMEKRVGSPHLPNQHTWYTTPVRPRLFYDTSPQP
jgi:hypothetical protein